MPGRTGGSGEKHHRLIDLVPFTVLREGYRGVGLLIEISRDRPGILSEVMEKLRSRAGPEVNIRWILGNALRSGRGFVYMILEVPSKKLGRLLEAVEEIEGVEGVAGVFYDVDKGRRYYSPNTIEASYRFLDSRIILSSRDFFDSLVEAIGDIADPAIGSLTKGLLFRLAYSRGFSIAETLRGLLGLKGEELVEAAFDYLKAMGWLSGFKVEYRRDGSVEVELRGLTIKPRIGGEGGSENPLITGFIAGALEVSLAREYRVRLEEASEEAGGYTCRIVATPL